MMIRTKITPQGGEPTMSSHKNLEVAQAWVAEFEANAISFNGGVTPWGPLGTYTVEYVEVVE